MALAIFALRQSAQPPRLEMPTPQCSDRFSLMHPEPSHPASSPMTSGQDKIAPPQLTTSRARNGRSPKDEGHGFRKKGMPGDQIRKLLGRGSRLAARKSVSQWTPRWRKKD